MNKFSLTAQQAAEIDKQARERIGIQTLVLMENAGRAVCEVALDLIEQFRNNRIAVFCGKGNNAGDGFVAARHLITHGQDVDVYLLGQQAQIKNEAGINLDILKKITEQIFEVKNLQDFDSINLRNYVLIIDALLGIGLKDEVRDLFKQAIIAINKSKVPVLSVDIPSGLDATTGDIHGAAISANTTVTFMADKQGLLVKDGPNCSGNVIVKDLGLPMKSL